MDPNLKKQLQHLDGVDVDWDVPLAGHTSLRVGGPVSCLISPRHLAGLQTAVRVLNTHHFPYFVMGRGSNLLVADAGVRAAAISLETGFSRVKLLEDRGGLRVGAGLRLSRLLRFALQHGLSGLEFVAGIPGSVGGAVRMNAGSYGRAMADVCTSVLLLQPHVSLERLSASQLRFSYRHLELPMGSLVLEADLLLTAGSPKVIREQIRTLIRKRKTSQPWRLPSAGSVFKNPPGDFAGRLIEAAGLKGVCIGNAQISEQHANFIVNRGRARAQDILALIHLAQEKVFEAFGVQLELEIQVIGNNLKEERG
jgi:UDP-N-acetylmuramate dehydrogenase